MEGTSCADDLSPSCGESDCCKRKRKSLLCSSVRMGFLRQARAGLVTSGCTLELVFVLFSAQWNRGSNESPSAIYQQVAFTPTKDEHSVPHSSPYRLLRRIILKKTKLCPQGSHGKIEVVLGVDQRAGFHSGWGHSLVDGGVKGNRICLSSGVPWRAWLGESQPS
jgi:hypothetical protein